MTTYNHMFTIAFEVPGSTSKDGDDVTAADFRKALLKRLNDLDDLEIMEAIGGPEDTYPEEPGCTMKGG